MSFLIKSMFFCVVLFAQQAVLAADRIEKNGDALHKLILAVGLASTIVYEEEHEGTIQLLKSFIVSQVVTQGLKRATQKTRPNGNCCSSFPSAHTSKAFMGAGFIINAMAGNMQFLLILLQAMLLIAVFMRTNILWKMLLLELP